MVGHVSNCMHTCYFRVCSEQDNSDSETENDSSSVGVEDDLPQSPEVEVISECSLNRINYCTLHSYRQ